MSLYCRRGICHASPRTGLFGIDGLLQPSDWRNLARDAIDRCKGIAQDIALSKPSVQVIQKLDDISDAVCQVYDSAELCRNVHADPVWRRAAHQTCTELGGFIHELNNNKALYSALVRSLEDHDLKSQQPGAQNFDEGQRDVCPEVAGFSRESVLVGRLLRRDFEMAGIHLNASQQQRVTELTAGILQTGFAITSNIAGRDVSNDESASNNGSGATSKSPFALLHDPEESERKQGFSMLLSAPAQNLPLLEALAAQRQELAQMLGSETYAQYALGGATLAATPEAVVRFLEDLNAALEPEIDAELAQLKKMKIQHTLGRAKHNPLQPWDQEFCKRMAKAEVNARLFDFREHFHVFCILNGLAEILQRTFRVRLETLKLQPGEAWADDLVKLSLSHEIDGLLGTVYLDLFSRAHKFSGCAHFTLKCARQRAGSGAQLPVVALVFNFSSHLLDPNEALTFFHEFGHALHSLLSKTHYQHLAGTRGPLDMIEIPSHFFEHFLRNDECLQLCMRHHQTGTPLPGSIIDLFRKDQEFMPALKLNETITYAMMDQTFHGKLRPDESRSAAVASVVERVHALHPADPHLHWHIRLGHLVSYGAAYYSYVYAKFIADAIWRQHFAESPFSQEGGAHVRTNLLDLGGAKEPKMLIDDLLGPGSLQSIGGGWAPAVGRF